ncbi:MAG: AraC family transcriptional regulator [Pseudomonadales bacterium]|nr:AraC family transcriptional regulator [Pseudomonadales bacterium]
MSATADLIRLLRLQVHIYHNAKVCGDWQIREHALGQTCFHIVTTGSCRVTIPRNLDTTLHAGDLILFPREVSHQLLPLEPLVGTQEHLPYHQAADLPGTGLLCAEMSFSHQASEQLLASLPEVVVIRNNADNPWLQPLLELTVRESHEHSSGSEAVLDRLCELLFIYALTHYFSNAPEQLTGTLALHSHPRLRHVLDALHSNPGAAWTLSSMAREAAQSRSLFANTFRQVSGWTPMQYLTWWRMQLASSHLQSGMSVAEVAESLGYRSQAAFSRAFKKCFGINAGQMRRGQQGKSQQTVLVKHAGTVENPV